MKVAEENAIIQLIKAHACQEGILWAMNHGGNLRQLWEACERPEWLLWFVTTQDCDAEDRRIQVHSARFSLALIDEALGRDHPNFAKVREILNARVSYGMGHGTKEDWQKGRVELDSLWPPSERGVAWCEAPLELRKEICDQVRAEFPCPRSKSE